MEAGCIFLYDVDIDFSIFSNFFEIEFNTSINVECIDYCWRDKLWGFSVDFLDKNNKRYMSFISMKAKILNLFKLFIVLLY